MDYFSLNFSIYSLSVARHITKTNHIPIKHEVPLYEMAIRSTTDSRVGPFRATNKSSPNHNVMISYEKANTLSVPEQTRRFTIRAWL